MDNRAFFFQHDSLLLPSDTPDEQIDTGVPVENTSSFKEFEIFRIPEINNGARSMITGVYVPPEAQLPDNWKSIPVRQILAMFNVLENNNKKFDKIIRALHICGWKRESRFCGTCGAKNSDAPEKELISTGVHRLCPNCGRMEFPRICPAVIVIITDSENRILLAHNKRFREGVYSHIAGFNEAGETLEETAAREIREEINIEVENIMYVKSQPWPFPNSLMTGFKARYVSGSIRPDGDEITDAAWFTKDNLPELPVQGSLSRYLIDEWLNGQK